MNWISRLPPTGHIIEAVSHYNYAEYLFQKGASNVETSRILFDALNKIQTEWVLQRDMPDQTNGEVNTFQTMVLECLDEISQQLFLQSDELRDLVNFDPQIMDHSILRRKGYRPDIAIDSELRNSASIKHHKLRNAYEAYLSRSDEETKQRVLKRAAELLYIVRSNIAHGEKTPYGPDNQKIERDKNVCRAIIPLQKVLLNLLLDSPEQKLMVYGTLAPGEVNHGVIAEIRGTWENCSVHGIISQINGFPAFIWDLTGPTQEVQLFTAPDLPEWWDQLDHFEGKYYQRILVSILTSKGLNIANCYQSNYTSVPSSSLIYLHNKVHPSLQQSQNSKPAAVKQGFL